MATSNPFSPEFIPDGYDDYVASTPGEALADIETERRAAAAHEYGPEAFWEMARDDVAGRS